MNKDFRDLLHALSDAEARFLVVGAYAVAVHGWPRATGDLDIWVEASPKNATRVFSALIVFGAPLDDLTEHDLTTPGIVFQLGRPPRRIDILTSVSGIETFESAWQNRIYARFGDREFPVMGSDDLIVNKRATGRDKDLVDANQLERIQRK
ncbi:MAG: hypothetical protein GY847_06955 [Proteobacteria bacterium]|nr:hypothetical protein [Pseudomonadota bacterium]